MKNIIAAAFMLLALPYSIVANPSEPVKSDANIVGHVVDKATGEHLPYVDIVLKGTVIGTVTDNTGHYYMKNLPTGEFTIEMSCLGYATQSRKIILKSGETLEINFEAVEDVSFLDEVVVSANRNETSRREAPTLVKVIDSRLFEVTNSHSLSQGLAFQPGVRIENDCQNCGYTQVRINGMDGKYTQILIDSRPIFSALASVYGLEQIPADMIDRVEIVRGGGSALFGSSAIAGTVNIITKQPLGNSGSLAHTVTNYDGSGSFDNNTALNLSLVSSDGKTGTYVYGQNRHKDAWDYNGDGFSELPELRNQTLGFNSYLRTSPYSRLTLEYHHMEEFRRGGNRQDLPPHIAVNPDLNGTGEMGLVEQVEHSIDAGSLKFNWYSKNQKHKANAYVSAQNICRKSYYNAYGRTTDLTGVAGAQYSYHFDNCIFMPADLTAGMEFNHETLDDTGTDLEKYYRAAREEHPDASTEELQELIAEYTPVPLHQVVNIYSAFVQNEWKNGQWSFLVGARLDRNSIMNHAVISPRANIRYNPVRDVNIRASYAKGFRAPQAFDEDLHIMAIGGELVTIARDKDLREESSHSFNLSADLYRSTGRVQLNFLLEGFFTRLLNPFVLTPPAEDPDRNGYMIQTRINGDGANVYGATFESRVLYGDKLDFQFGATWQQSIYDTPQEWSSDTEHLADGQRMTKKILRTPDLYGYFTASYSPAKAFTMALNGSYTGPMTVPHLLSEVDGSADELVRTRPFFELGARLSYDVDFGSRFCLRFNAGVQNILNSYQDDFDRGPSRDSGYMYGPGLPRTYFAGMKLSF